MVLYYGCSRDVHLDRLLSRCMVLCYGESRGMILYYLWRVARRDSPLWVVTRRVSFPSVVSRRDSSLRLVTRRDS